MFERPKVGEKAIVISLDFGGFDNDDDTLEIKELTKSAGFDVAELITSKRTEPHTKFFVGSGKIQEILSMKTSLEAKTLIFNHELSPSQERNIEKITGMRVYDRTALILFIFSLRAKSYEGKLQVELAHLDHLSTRLVKGWSHLERQKGGIGVRGGPGEKQIELDKRMLGIRIKQLKQKLSKLAKQRGMQRRARKRSQALSVSIVGYTNAGKSTLFNRLTHESIYAEDKLFATLDTTSRKLFIKPGHSIVISDTVGFIKNLPTTLIESFKSTLEEVTDSDLLLHVIDITNENKSEQIKQVEMILEEINANELPQILILNQIDKINLKTSFERDDYGKINHIQLSAKTGDGIEFLKQAIVEHNQSQINIRNGNYA
tara:strand:- start:454 stop:1575 length:1122 start_codon:yes stop_codon:yes gene_type:complete